ncbi:hypothetical protein GCM10020358_30660 [Amorphoplanes nipponensis]|uniref:Uncharacterized protein n=1 Tax=Actinoplanes nipponensis TaxID=135950 RepID=A0A919JH18_9ACTN|nr:hypothetical protein Ani05nite_01630 [Actinoplanes nipponensis]
MTQRCKTAGPQRRRAATGQDRNAAEPQRRRVAKTAVSQGPPCPKDRRVPRTAVSQGPPCRKDRRAARTAVTLRERGPALSGDSTPPRPKRRDGERWVEAPQ